MDSCWAVELIYGENPTFCVVKIQRKKGKNKQGIFQNHMGKEYFVGKREHFRSRIPVVCQITHGTLACRFVPIHLVA